MSTRLIAAKDASNLLGLDLQALYRRTRQGIIPAVRIGRLYRYNLDALEEWMRSGGQGLLSDPTAAIR